MRNCPPVRIFRARRSGDTDAKIARPDFYAHIAPESLSQKFYVRVGLCVLMCVCTYWMHLHLHLRIAFWCGNVRKRYAESDFCQLLFILFCIFGFLALDTQKCVGCQLAPSAKNMQTRWGRQLICRDTFDFAIDPFFSQITSPENSDSRDADALAGLGSRKSCHAYRTKINKILLK